MFENDHARYASYGVVNILPGEIIDQVWYIIDNDLQGMFELPHTLSLGLRNNDGQLTFDYSQNDTLVASFDTPYPFSDDFPENVWVFDDGESQIVLLPQEQL